MEFQVNIGKRVCVRGGILDGVVTVSWLFLRNGIRVIQCCLCRAQEINNLGLFILIDVPLFIWAKICQELLDCLVIFVQDCVFIAVGGVDLGI